MFPEKTCQSAGFFCKRGSGFYFFDNVKKIILIKKILYLQLLNGYLQQDNLSKIFQMCIIADLKAGDEKALKSVFDEYRHAVYNYVFDKTKSVYCSKEVVQLTFIKLWNYRHNLKEHVDISYQLFRIARTTMIDELRKVQSSHYVENLCGANAQTEDPEEAIFYNDTRNKLERLIGLMPPMRQRVFYLSRINNYSHQEIAQMLSISPKTVENHISLALKFIKPFFSLILLLSTV